MITKAMLVDALRLCFASSGQFAKHAMPLFLDKLQSDVEAAQLETMHTLCLCVRSSHYEPADYADLLEALLNTLFDILMKCSEATMEDAAIASIEAITLSLSTTVQLHTSREETNTASFSLLSIESFTNKLFIKCLPNLSKPDSAKLVAPIVKLLGSVGSSSLLLNEIVVARMLPFLLDLYGSTTSVNKNKNIR